MRLFTKKEINLTDDEWEILDGVMLMLRYAGNESENLGRILKPLARQVFPIYEQAKVNLPEGNVREASSESYGLTSLTELTKGRI